MVLSGALTLITGLAAAVSVNVTMYISMRAVIGIVSEGLYMGGIMLSKLTLYNFVNIHIEECYLHSYKVENAHLAGTFVSS